MREMKNLGMQCDLQSCALCETCIYDEDYQEENMENNTKMEFCNNCPFAYTLKVSTGCGTYHNFYCQNNVNKSNKLIDLSVKDGKNVNTPKWCPINMGINDNKFMSQKPIVKKTWSDLTPQLSFSDLQEGKVYHIPPYDNHARMDILITRKNDYSASYKILNEGRDTSYSINTLYPNTMAMRLITTHKLQEIEVKKKI